MPIEFSINWFVFSRKMMVNPSDDFLKAMKEEVGLDVVLV